MESSRNVGAIILLLCSHRDGMLFSHKYDQLLPVSEVRIPHMSLPDIVSDRLDMSIVEVWNVYTHCPARRVRMC